MAPRTQWTRNGLLEASTTAAADLVAGLVADRGPRHQSNVGCSTRRGMVTIVTSLARCTRTTSTPLHLVSNGSRIDSLGRARKKWGWSRVSKTFFSVLVRCVLILILRLRLTTRRDQRFHSLDTCCLGCAFQQRRPRRRRFRVWSNIYM